MSTDRVILSTDAATVEVAPADGGRIAQLTVAGRRLLVGPDHPEATATTAWGSFPMVPWAGRIRHGRFRFLGRDIQMGTNFQDGGGTDPGRRHAIHGTGFERAWTVVDHTTETVELTCPVAGGLGWPYEGTAHQLIGLGPDRLRCELGVSSHGAVFPADVGWHPWFVRPVALEFDPLAMYRQDEIGLPTGELVEPSPGPWDDCFVNIAPATLRYDGPGPAAVTLRSDCDHLVVFTQLPHAVCVEPQSGPPDSPTIRPRLVVPERPLTRWMELAWA